MFQTANGAKIYYEQHGAGSRDILLLHGWGCSTALWAPVTERLAKRARVTVLDFPGHGQSGRPPVPWGAQDFARCVAEMIQSLGIVGCDIVAHSHGGRIALVLAAEEPALVGKMVLTGASGLHAVPTEAQKRRTAAYKHLRALSQWLEAVKIFGPLPEKLRAYLSKKYGSSDYNALDDEMRKTFVKLVNFDVADDLPRVMAPTLLIWGSEDTETPLWMGQKMESDIPDAGLVVLTGGSHFAYLEKLGDFLRITEHFLLGGPE